MGRIIVEGRLIDPSPLPFLITGKMDAQISKKDEK